MLSSKVNYIKRLLKALFSTHHKELIPLLKPHIKEDGVVMAIGEQTGQEVKLFSKMTPRGHVYVFEKSPYGQSIISNVIRFKKLKNITLEKTNPANLTLSIDDYITDKYIRRVNFIKIENDGLELEILDGATKTIDTFRPVIYTRAADKLLENAGHSLSELWDFFKEKNYRIYLIEKDMSLVECSNPTKGNILCIPE